MIARRDSLISSTPRLIGGFDQLRFALQVINVDLELSRRLDVGDRSKWPWLAPNSCASLYSMVCNKVLVVPECSSGETPIQGVIA